MTSFSEVNKNEQHNIPGLVLLTHGNYGEALIASAAMIFGRLERVAAVPLNMGDDPDVYRANVQRILEQMPPGSLIMVDLFGGTPSNSVMMIAKDRDVFAVAGVNMGMLIEAANLRLSMSGKELLDSIVESGHNGIVNLSELAIKQSESA